MLQRCSWLVVGMMVLMAPCGVIAKGSEEGGSEAGLDLTLRTKAAAMPIKTLDGSALESAASHVMLLDLSSGAILAEKAGDQKMYPSSMTKMMTLYIVFERLKQGTLSLTDQFTVSEKAWRMQGSKMFVPLGNQVTLEDLIRGIAIQSGNDACVVIAEGIAGSEEAFAKQMNDTAKKLGMKDTNFVDASGWPSPDQTTTPRDLAILAAATIGNFPEYYHYFAEREFTYHGIRQFNRNLLLGNPSLKVDGLKTGHTEAAGYGITLSASEPASGRRLVLVINGLDSEAARAAEGERLLTWGFKNYMKIVALKAGKPILKAKVWMGEEREVPLLVASDISMITPRTGKADVKITASYNSPLIAPIKQGQEVGKVTLTTPDGSSKEFPLIAETAVEKLPYFARIMRALGM